MHQFTDGNLDEMREAIERALEPIANTYGIKFDLGNIKYSTLNFKASLTVSVIDTRGIVRTPGSTRLESEYPEHYLQSITLKNGTAATVIEFKSRAGRYPFIAQTLSGSRYKMSRRQLMNNANRETGLANF